MDIAVDSLFIQVFHRLIHIRDVDPCHTTVSHMHIQIACGNLCILVNLHLCHFSALNGSLHILIGIGLRLQKTAAQKEIRQQQDNCHGYIKTYSS